MYDENLIVIGTGIRTVGQLTMESMAWLRRADVVCHAVSDPVAVHLINDLASKAEDLQPYYGDGKPRIDTYHEMVDHVLAHVRAGKQVCFAAYGHPGVFAYPTHESIRRAREEGFKARMLPGISAEDCLFADLGVDPASHGCVSYEASDFISSAGQPDPGAHLVLWQIGVIGEANAPTGAQPTSGLQLLSQYLQNWYPPTHVVYKYEASVFVGVEPLIEAVSLGQLAQLQVTTASTLYVPPPVRRAIINPLPPVNA